MYRFVLLLIAGVLFSTNAMVWADGPGEGRSGRAEVRFMEGMIDHHQMAIDMSNECLAKASTEAVLAICQEIIDEQSAEIETLQGWLQEWYSISYSPMPMSEHMMAMEATPEPMPEGMMTDPAGMMGMMAFFNRTEGVEFEVAYLEAMADHHDDAIHMAQRIQTQAQHQPLLDMAQQIIDDQTEEIARIEQLLSELGEVQ